MKRKTDSKKYVVTVSAYTHKRLMVAKRKTKTPITKMVDSAVANYL